MLSAPYLFLNASLNFTFFREFILGRDKPPIHTFLILLKTLLISTLPPYKFFRLTDIFYLHIYKNIIFENKIWV